MMDRKEALMDRQQALRIVAEARAKGQRPDLSGAVLRGANLHGANLGGADLHGADLTGVNLSDADLTGAYLRDADLREANLTGADLRGAVLSGANLWGADLSAADLHGAVLSGANLYGAKGIWTIGPGGSRGDFAYAVQHGDHLMCKVGCQWFGLEEFAQAVEATHGQDQYGSYYRAVIAFFQAIKTGLPAKEEVR